MTKNYVLKPIYNDENKYINDTLSELKGGQVVQERGGGAREENLEELIV